MTEDPKISQRYRELPREEPPRALDDAILAAARRAAETRPAPLVVPTGRRRWYFPLAAAAVIVLAVAVTMHVERQQPDPEVAEQAVQSPRALEPAKPEPAQPAPARKAAPPTFTPDPKPQPPAADAGTRAPPSSAAESPPRELRAQRDAAPVDSMRGPDPTAQGSAAPQPGVTGGVEESRRAEAAAQRAAAERAAADRMQPAKVQRAPASAASTMAKVAAESPQQWLERIAELRKQGKHEEADKALAEFRRTYPDYRISEAMLEKVEKK